MRPLLRIEMAGLAALLAVAAAMAAYGFVDSRLEVNPLVGPASAARIAFLYTVIFGILPVVVYGAPVYWALRRAGLARWSTVLPLGAAPGTLALLGDREMGFWAVLCGAAVALLTHFMCREMNPKQP